jgi:hypothetical protein
VAGVTPVAPAWAKPVAPRIDAAVWTGECRCGAVVFETAKGQRYWLDPYGRAHTVKECLARKAWVTAS